MKKLVDHYAVMGNPIAHSLSPQIHTLFAKQTDQCMDYTAILVAADNLAPALQLFQASNGKGLNITLPFKETAFALVDNRTERAQLAQAVNTLLFQTDGKLLGDNTDGVGLVRDLRQNLKISLHDKTLLVLGAGGAARGIVPLLLAEKPRRLVIANRTVSKAQQLVADYKNIATATDLQACSYAELAEQAFAVVIHATAAGTLEQGLALPADLLVKNSYCYDLAYSKQGLPTAFLQWVQAQGCGLYSDGLGMLVEQAAESFYLWRGIKPKTQEVIKEIRRSLLNKS